MLYNIAIGVLVSGFLVIFFHIIFQCYPHDKRWSMDPTCTYPSLTERKPKTVSDTLQINAIRRTPRSTTGLPFSVSPLPAAA